MADNYFQQLNAVNVGDHTEKKNGLTYLSWAWAWAEVKKRFPEAFFTIYENKDGWFYHTDGKTCWVKTGVTINEIEHVEYLPVMDFKNKSIPLNEVTSFDVNKAIQRSLTKAVARHGLGLYIYAGEDLPEDDMNTHQTVKQHKDDIESEQEGFSDLSQPIGANTAKVLALMIQNYEKREKKSINTEALCERYGVSALKDLTGKDYAKIVKQLNE